MASFDFIAPPDRYFIWQERVVWTSATVGDHVMTQSIVIVQDWEVVEIQLDVIDTTATADGHFSWNLSTSIDDDPSHVVRCWNADSAVPATAGQGSVIRVSPAADNPLRRHLGWQMTHNFTGLESVTFQVQAFMKKRCDVQSPEARTARSLRDSLRVLAADLDRQGVTLAALARLGGGV